MIPLLRRPALAVVGLLLVAGCSLIQPTEVPPPLATRIAVTSALPRLDTSEGKDTSIGHNDPKGLWAATDISADEEWPEDSAALLERQRTWTRAIEDDFPPGGDVTCDPRTFIPLRQSDLINIGVTGPDPTLLTGPDPALLTKALSRAGVRISRVTGVGRELTEAEYEKFIEESDGIDDDSYTPNYVSDPESYTGVVGISNIDTKGVRYVWLQRTALRIVAEEVRRVGALPARIVPYLDVDTLEWLKSQHERIPTLEELH